MTDTTNPTPSNFIRSIIDEDNATGKYNVPLHRESPAKTAGLPNWPRAVPQLSLRLEY